MKANQVAVLCTMFVANAQAADYTFSSFGFAASTSWGGATHINNQGQILLQSDGGTYTYGLDLSTGAQPYLISSYNNNSYDENHVVTFRDFNNSGTYLGIDSVSKYGTFYSPGYDYTTEVVGNPYPGGLGAPSQISSKSCSVGTGDPLLCGVSYSNDIMTSNGLNDSYQLVGAFTQYFPGTASAPAGIYGDTYASIFSGQDIGTNNWGADNNITPLRLSDPSLGMRYSTANDISNQGTVVGFGAGRALLWTPDGGGYRTFSLGTLVDPSETLMGSPTSIAYKVNDSGMVIGRSTAVVTDANGQDVLSGASDGMGTSPLLDNDTSYFNGHAFVWKDGVMMDLGNVAVNALNNNGLVVGTARDANGEFGFLWKNGVGKLDLNSMVDTPNGYRIVSAEGINDQGMIVGSASFEVCSQPGDCHTEYTAYVLNPGQTGLTPTNPILQTSTTGNTFGFASGDNFIEILGNSSRPGGFYDPAVAVGYIFDMDSTDNAFTAVQVPYQYGDGIFELSIFDEVTGEYVETGTSLTAGGWYDFGNDGVKKFRITGIETSAYVDPNDPFGFVTGLTFTDVDAQFNMTAMQEFIDETNPLNELQAASVPAVPVPAAAWLFGSGLLGLIGMARRKAAYVYISN